MFRIIKEEVPRRFKQVLFLDGFREVLFSNLNRTEEGVGAS